MRRPCPGDGRAVQGGASGRPQLRRGCRAVRCPAAWPGRPGAEEADPVSVAGPEARLLGSYAPHVRPIAEALCFQGLRVGEALRLDWAHVDWAGNGLFVAETKTGDPRSVTMHPTVRKTLHRLWVGRGSPAEGCVFLNRVGRPYADPRRYKLPGGSPIRRAHQTACARAGVDDFHVHDWRHHWACRCVMSGIDLETIRQEGGWKSLRMVEHYATVSAAHRATAMKKLR